MMARQLHARVTAIKWQFQNLCDQLAETEKCTGKGEEGDVDFRLAFVANGELARAGQPAKRALHHPAMPPQPLAGLHAAPSERRSTTAVIVGLVGVHLARA